MTKEELEIVEIVNRETEAWNTQNIDKLITIFHPDMVWPWPKTSQSHDPLEWEFVLGRFNKDRWSKNWQCILPQKCSLPFFRTTLIYTFFI